MSYITDILDKNTETKAQTVELAKKLLKNPSLDKIKPTEQLFHYKTGLMYSLAFTSNSTDLKTAYDIFRDLSANSKYSTIHKYEECRQINRKIILQERYEMFASDSGALFVNLGKNITKISEYIKLKPEECFKEAAKWYDIALKIREEKYNDNAYDNSRLKAYLRSVNSKGIVYYYMKDYRKSYELREKIINNFPLSDYEHDNEIRDLLCTFRNNTVGCFEKMIDELDSAEIEKRKHQLEEYMREILKYHRFGTLFNTASKNKTKLDDIISHHTENGTLA